MDLGAPQPTDVGSERRLAWVVIGTFAAVAALATLDIVGDLGEGAPWRHVAIEGVLVAVAAAGAALVLRRLVRLHRDERSARAEAEQRSAVLGEELQRSRDEAARWQADAQDLLAGLSALIDRQFGRWGLTAAEREVALLLLKGLSHKEVAAARAVGEATVRQQAASVYRKAGLSGRHDLAAFFLEDLLAPRAQ